MEKAALLTVRNGLRKIKVAAVLEVRRLSKKDNNILCNNHEWEAATFKVEVGVPKIGGFVIYVCGPCAEKILKRKS